MLESATRELLVQNYKIENRRFVIMNLKSKFDQILIVF